MSMMASIAKEAAYEDIKKEVARMKKFYAASEPIQQVLKELDGILDEHIESAKND